MENKKIKCPYCGNSNTEKGRTGDEDQPDDDFYCVDCDNYFVKALELEEQIK